MTRPIARLLCLLALVWQPTTAVSPGRCTADTKPFDLRILVDGSQSIHPDDFQKEVDFVDNLLTEMDLSKARVSVDQFSFTRENYVPLPTYSSRQSLESIREGLDVLREKQQQSNTRTSIALEELYYDINTSKSRGRDQIILVLTDGNPTSSTYESSMNLRRYGAKIFAVGVGDEHQISTEELRQMASQPYENHVFRVQNFSELTNQITSDLVTWICPPKRCPCENGYGVQEGANSCYENICQSCNYGYELQENGYSFDQNRELVNCVESIPDCANVSADLTFIIDASRPLGPSDFEASVEFVRSVGNYVKISPAGSHFNLILFGSEAKTIYSDESDPNTLQSLSELRNAYNSSQDAKTDDALLVADELIDVAMASSGKQPPQQIIVLLTNGPRTGSGSDYTSEAARILHNKGYTIIVVGVGPEVKSYEGVLINLVAASEKKYFYVEDYSSLASKSREVTKRICVNKGLRPQQCRCQYGYAAVQLGCNWDECTSCFPGYHLNKNLARPVCVKDSSPPNCHDRTFDFYILFDGSDSLANNDFEAGMSWVRKAVSRFDFGIGKSRLTVGQYAYNYESELPVHKFIAGNYGYCSRRAWAAYNAPGTCRRPYTLSRISNPSYISSSLRKTVKIVRGGTYTGHAMKDMLEDMKRNPIVKADGSKTHTKRIMLVITDGKTHKDSDLPLLEKIAPEVKKEATVVAIGVGDTPIQKELELIASEKRYAFRVDDYLSLDRQVTETLSRKLCEPEVVTEPERCDCEHGTGTVVKIPRNWPSSFTPEQAKNYFCEDTKPCKSCDDNYHLSASGVCAACRKRDLEVLIVIDSSSIIDSQDFTRVKELIETLVDRMKIANNLGEDKSDISILVYRGKGPYFFHFLPLLQRSIDENEIRKALYKIDPNDSSSVFTEMQEQGEYCEKCSSLTGLESATEFLSRVGDQGTYGKYSKDKSFAVVFTAAHREDANRLGDIKAASKKLQNYVGDVAAIGLGPRPDDSVLKAIATHPYYIYKPFTTGEFDALNRQIVDTVNKCADDYD